MTQIQRVTAVFALKFGETFPSIPNLYVAALGEVPTTGWSNIMLLPRVYVNPPTDGIWDFDFVGSPAGIAADIVLPVHASYAGHAPKWVKGVRVHAAQNAQESGPLRQAKVLEKRPDELERKALGRNAIIERTIAIYDDSFQPIGLCGGFHVKMKKLRHELTLTVNGPDEDKIRHCIDEAFAAGLLAALIAAFASGGMGAAQAFIAAALSSLGGCLGSSYSVRFDDKSHWIEWCT